MFMYEWYHGYALKAVIMTGKIVALYVIVEGELV